MIAGFAADKKAENINVLDMRKVVNFCDFFVICTGNSTKHVSAIADEIEEQLDKLGQVVYFRQGSTDARWLILDLGSIVLHVFEPETREFYGLDYLWQEAKQINWEE